MKKKPRKPRKSQLAAARKLRAIANRPCPSCGSTPCLAHAGADPLATAATMLFLELVRSFVQPIMQSANPVIEKYVEPLEEGWKEL